MFMYQNGSSEEESGDGMIGVGGLRVPTNDERVRSGKSEEWEE